MLFPKNIGEKLSIDEVAISNGELYAIITNKAAKGGKGALVAMVNGIRSANIVDVLIKIPLEERKMVKEVTLDMSHSMDLVVRCAFPKATIVTDRFHVQRLVTEAVQEIRVGIRKEVIQEENEAIKKAKEERRQYKPEFYDNGDTKKQLLARSRYLLFKPQSKWTQRQKARSVFLFQEFPEIEEAYKLSMMFRSCYEFSKTIEEAKDKKDEVFIKPEMLRYVERLQAYLQKNSFAKIDSTYCPRIFSISIFLP